MVIDANVYWFPEQVFKDDRLLQTFLADIPRLMEPWDGSGTMTEERKSSSSAPQAAQA